MDVSAIARAATSIADTGLKQDVALAVQKKAQDVQASSAQALIEAIPPVPKASNLPSNLGNNINTTA
ncbi:hypothetical protein ASC94_24300 [Massilia sp. Root418]|jgi:hypothetical protein|uniref:YjfB family protein n=1 Tax=Massilia sp. Root418 TaxID=1736532 RepID=UPI0006F72AEA|nr:YjfB family protein [Massilia sp. Root418]KQW88537.1 hypothetical protein ASC94_24300 [Massilia sp. Root418]